MSTEQINLLVSELLYHKKIESQADFSRKLGYKGRSYVSDMLSGKKEANIDNAVLKTFSEVSPDWLKTGKGDVLIGTKKPTSIDAGNDLLFELLRTQTEILKRLESKDTQIEGKVAEVKKIASSAAKKSDDNETEILETRLKLNEFIDTTDARLEIHQDNLKEYEAKSRALRYLLLESAPDYLSLEPSERKALFDTTWKKYLGRKSGGKTAATGSSRSVNS